MKKLLRDEDYWRALDEISRLKWAVFSVRAHRGEWGMPTFPPGTIGMMTMVWKEPAANRELLSAFELDDTKDLPSVVVFVLDRDQLHRARARIDRSSVETAYGSLKAVFTQVAGALESRFHLRTFGILRRSSLVSSPRCERSETESGWATRIGS